MNNQEEFHEEESNQEVLMLRFQLFIPENGYGIEEGYYIGNAIVKLLRDKGFIPSETLSSAKGANPQADTSK